jgi:sugar transferase (PEP-CTERM/EpsH1 system associated)
VGGLENGLVNLINHMPPERYRHAIICLKNSTNFRDRIKPQRIEVIELNKKEGKDFGLYGRLWKVLRTLRPAIVHTRNLSGLEYLMPSALAGIPGRIHGEHGLDIYELNGSNNKYNLLRKVMRPVVHQYIAVSSDLARWLTHTIGVHPDQLKQIYNGVDLKRFSPRNGDRSSVLSPEFATPDTFIVGTVGRLEIVKDQLTLVRAFLHLVGTDPRARERLRLVVVGEGALRNEAQRILREGNAEHLCWLPGERDDVPDILRSLDLFVLPSLREGISNTILEAMASGLPVVATKVGGNPELVEEGKTGILVPVSDPVAMANAIRTYIDQPELLIIHGQAGRKRAEEYFSMEKMVNGYLAVYDAVLKRRKDGVK